MQVVAPDGRVDGEAVPFGVFVVGSADSVDVARGDGSGEQVGVHTADGACAKEQDSWCS